MVSGWAWDVLRWRGVGVSKGFDVGKSDFMLALADLGRGLWRHSAQWSDSVSRGECVC